MKYVDVFITHLLSSHSNKQKIKPTPEAYFQKKTTISPINRKFKVKFLNIKNHSYPIHSKLYYPSHTHMHTH